MTPNIISEIFKVAGMNVPVRNFLVDYSGAKGESCYKPMQVVCVRDYSDSEIINNIMQDVEMKNMTVNAITEIFGEHSVDDLSIIAKNANLLLATGFKYLYLRNKKSH